MSHQNFNSWSLAWESKVSNIRLQLTPIWQMGMQISLYHPPFTSQSDLFTSVVYSTFALTNKKGVAYAVGTWALVSPRNLHTKFHVSGVQGDGR